MDSDTIFCIGTPLPCNNINIGYHVQGYGHQQCQDCPIHKHPVDTLDNKASMEPYRRDGEHKAQMDIGIAAAARNMLCSDSIGHPIGTFSRTDNTDIHSWRIRFIDPRHCS